MTTANSDVQTLSQDLHAKVRVVEESLQTRGRVLVAFSGGVDSALLAALAHRALGSGCEVFTAVSPSLPQRELQEAQEFTRALGVTHHLLETRELEREGFAENTGFRCFHCKLELFDQGWELARELGIEHIVYGATLDDLGDHRPGMQAAKDQGATAPLMDAGLTKGEIRDVSRWLNLPTWNKPAMACLSSRFPYGTRVTKEGLGKVERAEDAMVVLGFREFRVRFHDDVARLEVSAAEWSKLTNPELRREVTRALQAAGFRFVAIDLEPFVSGNLNRTLESQDTP